MNPFLVVIAQRKPLDLVHLAIDESNFHDFETKDHILSVFGFLCNRTCLSPHS